MSADSNKIARKETRNSFKELDEHIHLLDYKNNYDVDAVIKNGISNIGELITFMVKRSHFKEKDFTIGEAKGGGCSSFNAFTPEGDHIMGRNFDFKVAPCLVLWTHPKNHYASVSVVDDNFLTYGEKRHKFNKNRTAQLLLAPYCCVDGVNEMGLSIAVLQIRAKATKQTDSNKPNICTTAMIRCVLDTCKDVDEAIEFIKGYNMHDSLFCCYHYQISDKSGRSVVVEYIDNVLHIYEKNSEKYGIDGSVYEGDNLSKIYVTNYSVTKDIGSFKIEQHGMDRAEAIIEVLKNKNEVLTEIEAMDLLNYVKLDYDHPKYPWRIEALWSAVYNSTKATLKIAAHTDYSRIYNFSATEPMKVLSTDSITESAYPVKEWDYL